MTLLTRTNYQHLLRNDLMAFIERSFCELNPQARFVPGRHLEVIAAKLEQCRTGKIKRLIINIHPRSLKSLCASVAFPAWVLGHDPSQNIICVSYGQDLADTFARNCRTVMTSSFYQRLFPTRLASRQAVADFTTTLHGGRMATSVGGVLTGRGADLIIIDDPLKPDEALSESRRTAVNDWYDNTLLSRLNDKENGCIIIIMQRLHQDDLVGHVLEQGDWDIVSFPAIAEIDETFLIDTVYGRRSFVRKAGQPLHAERESLQTLATIRQTMGEYNFDSQYQQNPSPPGGAMVKYAWIQYYDSLPAEPIMVVQSWDTANKPGELNDYSVCTTWFIYDNRYYLADVFRRKLNFPDLKRAVLSQADRFGATVILIEDKASGTQLIQDLRADGVFGVKEYKAPPGTDKIMRLHAQTMGFENGLVFLPREAPWLPDYLAELTTFPGSRYDDQVDSTTQALDYMRSTYSGLGVWARLAG